MKAQCIENARVALGEHNIEVVGSIDYMRSCLCINKDVKK